MEKKENDDPTLIFWLVRHRPPNRTGTRLAWGSYAGHDLEKIESRNRRPDDVMSGYGPIEFFSKRRGLRKEFHWFFSKTYDFRVPSRHFTTYASSFFEQSENEQTIKPTLNLTNRNHRMQGFGMEHSHEFRYDSLVLAMSKHLSRNKLLFDTACSIGLLSVFFFSFLIEPNDRRWIFRKLFWHFSFESPLTFTRIIKRPP